MAWTKQQEQAIYTRGKIFWYPPVPEAENRGFIRTDFGCLYAWNGYQKHFGVDLYQCRRFGNERTNPQ